MKSDNVTKGRDRAPHRSLFWAMGYTEEELNRPLVGVCCAKNEIIPGHIYLDKIAEAVKAGVRMAGGTPIEFLVIGVCDGIAMGHERMCYSGRINSETEYHDGRTNDPVQIGKHR